MTKTTLSCEQCGGQIELDDSKSSGFCNHCGTKILIKDNIGNQTIINTNVIQNVESTAPKKFPVFLISAILTAIVVFVIAFPLFYFQPWNTSTETEKELTLSDIVITDRNDTVWWIENDVWGASILINIKNNNKHHDAEIIITFEIQDDELNVMRSVDKEVTVKSQDTTSVLISTTIDTIQRNSYRFYNTPIRLA